MLKESEKNSKHWRLSVVQVQHFYYLLLSLGFQHQERDTQFLLCWLFHLTPPCAAHPVDPTGLAQVRISTRPVYIQISINCIFFQKSPKILSPSLPGMTSFTYPGFFIMTSVIITSSPREREHLRSMCAPTRALSRRVLSLTKPKDKI